MPKNKKFIINEKIIHIAEKILEFNREEQSGHGIKILTPNQTLAQLKAGNNSEKLKNEIRQLLYSLCRSKNLQSNYIKV